MKKITYGVVTTILLVLGTGMPLVEAQSSNSTNTDWFFDMLLSDLIIHPADSNGMMMYPLPIEEINIGNESITYGVEVTNSNVAPTCNPTNGPQPYEGPTSHMSPQWELPFLVTGYDSTSSSFWIFTHAVSSGNSTVTCTSGSTTASLSVTTDTVYHDLSWGMPEVEAEPEPEPEVETTTTTNLTIDYVVTIMGHEGCEQTWGCFSPYTLGVPANSYVTFDNPTANAHAISGGGSDDGTFESGLIMAGQSWTIPFPLVDEEVISYTCDLHPWEYGTIAVGDVEFVPNDVLSGILNSVPIETPPLDSEMNTSEFEAIIDTKNEQIHILNNQLASVIDEATTLVNSNVILQAEVANLQYQVANQPVVNATSTAEIESLQIELDKWQEAADRWKAVALNQLQIMVNVLGL